jgi:amidase
MSSTPTTDNPPDNPPPAERPKPTTTDDEYEKYLSSIAETKWTAISNEKKNTREELLKKWDFYRLKKMPSEDVLDVSWLMFDKLNSKEKSMVPYDATDLLSQIHARHLTAEEVIEAYIKVAVVAQDLTNCITEICFDDALERAKWLDKEIKRTGKPVGPLHGLPFSIKDHVLVKGLYTSTGYIAWAQQQLDWERDYEQAVANKASPEELAKLPRGKAQEDAVVVDLLRKAGAVFYVKTANPQTLLSLETMNNIFGRTLNPYNRKLSPGGSSGGEAALIASHGSPLGIGTDIGGSIRAPAAFCGIYGFKPSVARMPHAGLLGSHDGMDNIVGVVGPMARSARDLALFCRVMLESEAWREEHAVLEMPWKEDVVRGVGLPDKLSFAILWDDKVVTPHEPIRRKLVDVKKALVKAGHEVIDWTPHRHQDAWDIISQLYLLDGGDEYWATIAQGHETAVKNTKWVLASTSTSSEDRPKPKSIPEIFELNLKREQFRKEVLRHWNATKERTGTGRAVDGIICPAFATLAPPHNTTRWWGYTSYWNLADYPGVVFPMGQCDPSEYTPSPTPPPPPSDPSDPKPELAADENAADNIPYTGLKMKKFVEGQWDPMTYKDAPISLQLVGRRYNEEKVLAMLDVVERCIKDSSHGKWEGLDDKDKS